MALGFAAVLVLLTLPATAFIGARCYSSTSAGRPVPEAVRRAAAENPRYVRDEASTYLTFPEWYIVYSTDEHAAFVEKEAPSAFPYFGSIGQFWSHYGSVCSATKGVYPFNWGTHLMLGVIGVSFTVENGLKGLYENTVGRLTEGLASHDTEEDRFAHLTEREYGAFMHHTPWYRFPFGTKLASLWNEVPFWGAHPVRKLERRAALTLEYSFKAVYGWLIGRGTATVYEPADLLTHARVSKSPDRRASQIVSFPRYEAFTPSALELIDEGGAFVDVAGNERMLVTAIAPPGAGSTLDDGRVLFRAPILTNREQERIAVDAPVSSLHTIVRQMRQAKFRVEHLYDY